MGAFNLNVNGRLYRVSAAPDMPLLWALRDFLHLTGTKYGVASVKRDSLVLPKYLALRA
jgi:aerobic-type carbon monoxide dehydrogenase small subunit (CoxS/CutS family)